MSSCSSDIKHVWKRLGKSGLENLPERRSVEAQEYGPKIGDTQKLDDRENLYVME